MIRMASQAKVFNSIGSCPRSPMSVKKFQSAWGTRNPNNMDFFLEPDEKEGAEMDIGLLFNFKMDVRGEWTFMMV